MLRSTIANRIMKLNGFLICTHHPLNSNATHIWARHRNIYLSPIKMPLHEYRLVAALHHGEIQERNDDGPGNADGEEGASVGQS